MKKILILSTIIIFVSLPFYAQSVAESKKASYHISKKIIIKNIDKTPPYITITNPIIDKGLKIINKNKQLIVKGIVTDESGVYEVLVNNEEAILQADGNFSYTVLLAVGENIITVQATDIKKNNSTTQFKVERKSNEIDIDNKILNTGKYYAIIIGVQDYFDYKINDLDEPINDAQKLYNMLTTYYQFMENNVLFLKNPKKSDLVQTLYNMRKQLTKNDNLLIFYAGHGIWDEGMQTGYWLPVDANKDNPVNWFPNTELRGYLKAILTKHTLLITDACFSGSIFKTREVFTDAPPSINELYKLPSRKAITSGNMKTVSDKSVFIEYLIKRLEQNNKKYLSAGELFISFRKAVINNSPNNQVPQFGIIQQAGDEGGDFIFIRK